EKDLKIIEENRSLTLLEWAEFFMKIISENFSLNFQKDDSENFSNFIEKSAFDACFEFLNSLKEIKISKKFKEDRYSFEVIFDLFEKHLKRTKTHFNPNDQMAISFTSFETSSLPSKAVFLIGLDENVLTIKDQNSLSLTANLNIPTDSEHIRSRFLQSLLSAKNNLYLSYTSKDGGLIDSSILLQEFITYLDDSYRILKNKPSDYIIKKNTPFSFHKNNFTKGSSSFAGQDFIAAKAYWNTNNRKEAKFKGDFKENKHLDDDIPEVIDLKSLKKLSKNPIRFYLNEGLDIYLESKIDISDFNVSFLDKYLIKRASSNDKIDDILFSYEKEAKMPLGFFGEIEKRAIIESHTQFHRDLKNLGIDKDKIISIDLSLSCQNIEKIDENNIKMPAVEINIQDKKVKIIGRLDNISDKGLLVYSDDKVSSLVQIWAEILIFYKLKLKNIPKQILFMKNNKVKDFKIDDLEKNLSNYIQYYLNSKKSISYMIPSFSEHILKKDERSFQKAINNIKKNRILDVYFSWLSQNDKIIEPRKIIESQSDYMQSIFRTILEDF
ncbi:MAG: hypothetical protein K1000chlam1_01610, partial [Candidatus Anoxychlamydiales bacterium]|nr:hypothetical protein [Candidatus Anoxychlamydiales bacterium]